MSKRKRVWLFIGHLLFSLLTTLLSIALVVVAYKAKDMNTAEKIMYYIFASLILSFEILDFFVGYKETFD